MFKEAGGNGCAKIFVRVCAPTQREGQNFIGVRVDELTDLDNCLLPRIWLTIGCRQTR
jgi:hypothetical protein